MITRIITSGSEQNGAKYSELFRSASEELGITDEKEYIYTLNQYFQNLPDLLKTDNYHKYVRLPLDEDLFEIDANTRTITVPTSFKSGAGVQGDQAAETIFFVVDRYFDTMDLNNQNIYIEWKAPGREGFSKEFARDIESYPNKIVFGWVLEDKITETPGTIQFAIRFFTVEDNEDLGEKVVRYSLSTKPQSITINKGINLSILDDSIEILDSQSLIFDRIVESKPDPNQPVAEPAAVILDFQKDDEFIFNEDGKLKAYFKNEEDYITALIQGCSLDGGVVSYYLQRKEGGLWRDVNDDSVGKLEVLYIETEDTEPQSNNIYYKLEEVNGVDAYTPQETLGNPKEEGLYEQYYKCYIGKVGFYQVVIKNRNGVNINSSTTTATIEIPMPTEPVIDTTLQRAFIENEDGVTLSLKKLADNETMLGDKRGEVTFFWKYNDEIIDGAVDTEYVATEEGIYSLVPVNNLNKTSTNGTPCNYRVTYMPGEPKFSINPAAGESIFYGSTQTFEVIVANENECADDVYVAWYKISNPQENKKPNMDEDILISDFTIVSASGKSVYVEPKENGLYYAAIKNKYNEKFSEPVTTDVWVVMA